LGGFQFACSLSKDEALRSSYMTHAEAVVVAEAIAKLPDLAAHAD